MTDATVFAGLQQFETANPSCAKWSSFRDAVRKSQSDPQPYARSVGTAVTYWMEQAESEAFSNSRMYQTFLMSADQPVLVELAAIADLTAIDSYQDTSDKQRFRGAGILLRLEPFHILAVSPSQAWRYASGSSPLAVHHFRVTLAGPVLRGFEEAAA